MLICWINGAFGVGKTTVSRALERKWPDAYRFDPEQIGFMLRRVVPAESGIGDFQDLPLWRQLTVATAIGLLRQYRRPLIVPMTVVDQQYFDEIVGTLRRAGVEIHHFTLVASRETLRKRIRRRLLLPSAKRWVYAQVERCVTALSLPAFGLHIPTDGRPVEEIVEEILSHLPKPLVGGA